MHRGRTLITRTVLRALPQTQNNSFFTTHCLAYCKPRPNAPTVYKCGASDRRTPAQNMRHLLKMCGAHAKINYTEELPAMVRDTRQLTHAEYLRLAMRHRFCLVAPGDFTSTHKITEAVALGAAGGCVPVLVLPGKPKDVGTQVAHMLPYARWLDWCEIAYLVPESEAAGGMAAVLRQLESLSKEEVEQKRRALRRVRDAFGARYVRDVIVMRSSSAG